MKPTPKKKRRSKAPAPKPTKVRGGRSRSEATCKVHCLACGKQCVQSQGHSGKHLDSVGHSWNVVSAKRIEENQRAKDDAAKAFVPYDHRKRAKGKPAARHAKAAAAEAKRLHKNEQARARRAAIKQAKRAQSLAHMRPGKRTAFLAREQRNEQSDRAAWKKAGKPYAFERWQSYRDGARTRKTLSLKVELSHKRAQIFGYEDAKGNDTGKVPERHMLEGSNPDHRTLLIEMMRSGDQRWLDYLDEAYDLGLDYDEAADTWFSPEV